MATCVGLITFYRISNVIQPTLLGIRHYPYPTGRVMNALVFAHCQQNSYTFGCYDFGHSSLSGSPLPAESS